MLKKWYSRSVDGERKRDVECWYIDRPGVTEEELDQWKVVVRMEMPRKGELEKEKEEEKARGVVD